MGDFVVDASVAAAWFLPDEQSSSADKLFAELAVADAYVPTLWHLEVRNLVLIAERRGRLSSSAAVRSLAAIEQCPVLTDDSSDLKATMDVARRHQLTFYDALYLELTIRRRLPLATLDKALQRAAAALGLLLVSG